MVIMIFNNFNLANDTEFEIFAKQITEDFIAFKIKECKNLGIFDSLLKYAQLKEIDEDLLGECVKNDATIKGLIQKEIESHLELDNSEW